jgi:glycosyltransferase involved in cell wall biosynthesis
MKILYLVPYVPNLVRVRPYNLIRTLNQRGHQVTLLTLVSDASELAGLDQLEKEGLQIKAFGLPRWRSMINSLAAVPTREPLQARFCWQPALAKALLACVKEQKSAQPIDAILIEHLRGVRYGIWLKEQANLSNHLKLPPIIWDSVDSITHLFRQVLKSKGQLKSRLMAWVELKRTARLEQRMIGYFSHMLVTSPIDRSAFLALNDSQTINDNISVIPNGVDLDYFKPDPQVKREKSYLVVSGKMSYHANVAMVMRLANEIMPHVWEKKPDVDLWVVGKDPPPVVRRLATNPNIHITGTVPDIRPYLRKATLAVAPVPYGAGIQNKVLEALACGTAVITTHQAVSALMASPGSDLLVCDTSEEFGKIILELLGNPERREKIQHAGRKYVETYHEWSKIVSDLEMIISKTHH